MEAEAAPILLVRKARLTVDLVAAVTNTLRQPGQSGWRLARQVLRCRLSVQKLSSEEFFRYGLHRPTVTDTERATFLGDRAMWNFNVLLNGPPGQNHTAVMRDKLATANLLRNAGLRQAVELATFHPQSGTLRSAAEVAAFLLNSDNLPLFGKPVHGRHTLGVVAVERAAGDERVELGDGRVVKAAALAAEIAAHYAQGYVFQELLRASAAIRPLSGPVVPTLRVATLLLSGAPHPLYATMRLPAVGAMDDDGGPGVTARLHLDVATGDVLRGQDMCRFGGVDLPAAPVTGLALRGQSIPDWPEVLRIATLVHRQFPGHTCIGTDIALSHRGLVVNEANSYPHHMTYQMVSRCGILNHGFRPLFRQALAEKGITSAPRGVPWPSP